MASALDDCPIPYSPVFASARRAALSSARASYADSAGESYAALARDNPGAAPDFYATERADISALERRDCAPSERTRSLADLLMAPELMVAQRARHYARGECPHSISIVPFSDSAAFDCFCGLRIPGAGKIKCALCGCICHTSCYHIRENAVPSTFVCVHCQYKIARVAHRLLSEYLDGVYNVYAQCFTELMMVNAQTKNTLADSFVNVSGKRSLQDICKAFAEFIEFCNEGWFCLGRNWSETQQYVRTLALWKRSGSSEEAGEGEGEEEESEEEYSEGL